MSAEHPQQPAAGLPAWWQRLPGGSVIWIVVLAELLTFFLFFVAYAASYRSDPGTYAASQASLSRGSGAINTAVLLTGSWMAARGVLAHDQGTSARGWWLGAALSGVLFTGIKLSEYAHVFGAGINLSTNGFWFFYLFLTVMHLGHVLAGIGFAGAMALRPPSRAPSSLETAEATATYWHLVDLIWILLFPLLYLVRMQ